MNAIAKTYKVKLIFTLLVILLVAFFILDLFLGSVVIPFKDILSILLDRGDVSSESSSIILNFRLPKALTALFAGLALSVSGLLMQTTFRNPLAGPFVLGISSGAGLGVAIVVMGFSSVLNFTHASILNNWAIVMAAWLGSGFILILILIVSTRIKDIMTILILGLMFSSAASAIISILQYFSNEAMLKSYVLWTMGSLGSVTKSQLYMLIPGVLLGLSLAVISIKWLDAFLLGENYAKSLGMNIKTSRNLIFLSTSLLAGSVTAFCGPIGFIGIAIPHIARMIFNTASHKILLPGSVLMGAIALLLSDIISQLPGNQVNLPINSITALIGIPVVMWIVFKNKKIAKV